MKLAGEPVESKYGVKVLEIYDIDDITEWRKWRDEMKLPSASMLSSAFGCGYNSFNQEIKEITGLVEKAPVTSFAKKLMDHGSAFEPRARSIYLEHLEGDWTPRSKGNASFICETTDSKDTYKFLITPDLVMQKTTTIPVKKIGRASCRERV